MQASKCSYYNWLGYEESKVYIEHQMQLKSWHGTLEFGFANHFSRISIYIWIRSHHVQKLDCWLYKWTVCLTGAISILLQWNFEKFGLYHSKFSLSR